MLPMGGRSSRSAPQVAAVMPTIASSELPVPKSWDEFEDICPDLFSQIWNDPNIVRYGRLGQRQNGVDIRGRSQDGRIAGVQCKRKRQWPVVELTTVEIDAEVAEALKFTPPLSELTMATTAPNDAKLQAHVDAITERHRTQGLFSVHLLCWNELSRRIATHSQLVEKHYGFVALSTVRDRIGEIPTETARLVTDNLRQLGLPVGIPTVDAQPPSVDILRPGLADALERDFQRRYAQAMRRSIFPELLKNDLFRNLANEVREENALTLSAGLRRAIFLRTARGRALRNDVAQAEEYFAAALALPGSEGELAARARITEARGDSEGAIRVLRDEKDADCRSVLLDIIAKHKGDAGALDWLRDQSLSPVDLAPHGVMALYQIYLRRQDFAVVKQILCRSKRRPTSRVSLLLVLPGDRPLCCGLVPTRAGPSAHWTSGRCSPCTTDSAGPTIGGTARRSAQRPRTLSFGQRRSRIARGSASCRSLPNVVRPASSEAPRGGSDSARRRHG